MKVQATTHSLPRHEGELCSDALDVQVWDQTVMAVLCDGAGTGAPACEAANRAVTALVEQYGARPRSWSPAQALAEFTGLLNLTLYQESMARYNRPEMISTLAVVVIEGDRLYGLNAGDSRVLLWRAGDLRTLSVDHVDAHQKNLLVNALGMSAGLEPHVFETELHNGDRVLLCSDGLSNHLDDETLKTYFQSAVPPGCWSSPPGTPPAGNPSMTPAPSCSTSSRPGNSAPWPPGCSSSHKTSPRGRSSTATS